MARIRTIKPEFFSDWDLYQAEFETGLPLRVAFAGLWTQADREGRFRWVPQQLKLGCLPYDEVDFSRVLDALTTRELLVKYTLGGVDYGVIKNFKRHQVINNRERPSELPSLENSCNDSIASTREPRVNHARGTPLMHAQGEGKGKEGEKKEPPMVPPRTKSTAIKNQKTSMPDIFTPSKACRDFATGNNIDFEFEFDQFKNHSRANGKQFVNWQAAFRTWLGNTVKFAAGKPKFKILADDEDPTKDWVYS